MTPELRDGRRSAHAAHLFVPATRTDLPAKAAGGAASAVILDLEDSVPAAEKLAARDLLPAAANTLREGGKSVLVRVNNTSSLLEGDVHAALEAGVEALVLPKVEDRELLAMVDAWLDAWERDNARAENSVELELQIESPAGVLAAPTLATVLPRIASMMLGVEDLATELGIDPDGPDTDLAWAHGRVLMAATAAGIWPYGLLGSFSNFRDLDTYRVAVRRSQAFGYVGAYCIHPDQAALAAEGFLPSAAELEHARRVVEAYSQAESQGQSATSLDGAMIDRPIAVRSERLLARAAQSQAAPSTPAPPKNSAPKDS
ncbi:HpcH/HpaI aldolase/citrate lyase family protein [Aeromicrobium sp. CTD01-1L150]|uniref:HpcH/HpaI aldolase/citrate lyase family protein n=1 Tax=Aeromicrobium sp. CTD01-1L150 TaxID=3341830 RepID=UPI0035BF8521